jgi:hypothetical protein
MALERETEMKAALTYIGTRYGTDTAQLNSLLVNFRAAEAGIPSARTDAEIDVLIAGLRQIAGQFQKETVSQMNRGYGAWDDLELGMMKATANNPYIEEKKNFYWSTRISGQISDFDTWAQGEQAHLDGLVERGYDTARAQRALDVVVAKRPELQAALESKSEDRVNAAAGTLLALTGDYAVKLKETQQQVPDDARIRFLLEQADRTVVKADRLNTDTILVIIEIGDAEPALSKLKSDLVATRLLLNAGRLEAARKNLLILKKDYTDLAQAYQTLATSANLPPDLQQALAAMSVALHNTADRMEAG